MSMESNQAFRFANFFKKRFSGRRAKSGNASIEKPEVWVPALNQVETRLAFLFILFLPNAKKESISVEVAENMLKIKGCSKKGTTSSKRHDHHIHQVPLDWDSFYVKHPIPENGSKSNIEASFNNELLTIRIPKLETSRPAGFSIRVK